MSDDTRDGPPIVYWPFQRAWWHVQFIAGSGWSVKEMKPSAPLQADPGTPRIPPNPHRGIWHAEKADVIPLTPRKGVKR